MMRDGIFVTGGTGFVGRRVVAALRATGRPVLALDRAPSDRGSIDGAERVAGDLLNPTSYEAALRRCDTVVHLAAATGRAPAEEHARVNARGTEALLDASRKAGVSRFLFVSSIAVTFPRLGGYHYALAKQVAERAVQGSGLQTAILRPTVILGPGAPILSALERLAGLPRAVAPGSGRARVQPVHVDDVARAIAVVVEKGLWSGEVLEIGGPETLTMDDLIGRIRRTQFGRTGSVVHVPLWLLRPPLRIAEALGAVRLLPITAGQLSSFEWDGIAAPNRLQAAIAPGLIPLEQMLSDRGPARIVRGGSQVPAAVLEGECRVFTRHLLGSEATPYVVKHYVAAHEALPALAARRPFDAALVRFARRHRVLAGLADSYSAALARDTVLRRKLVVLLAILESSSPSHQDIDRALPGTTPAVLARMILRGMVGLVMLLAGVVVLTPLRVTASLAGRDST